MKKDGYDTTVLENKLIEEDLQYYFNIVKQYDVLSSEEQLELLRQYREDGNKESYQKLVYHNLRLAIFVAKEYKDTCYSLSFMDLIQEGTIAIMKALDGYDFSNDTKLSTYMVEVISKNIQRQMEITDTLVRRPSHLVYKQKKLHDYKVKYLIENGKYPTEEEIKNHLEISDDMYKHITESEVFYPISLNKQMEKEDGEKKELEYFIQDPEDKYLSFEDFINDKEIIVTAKEILSNKEYYVIYYRIIKEQKTLTALAKEMGVTKSTIRQIQLKALRKLKCIRLKRKMVLEKYTIKDIAIMDVSPVLSPIKLSVYKHLKNNLDPLTYYFIYTKREKKYTTKDYKEKFKELTEEEIEEYLNYCEDIASSVFSEERRKIIYNKIRQKLSLSHIFDFDIEPDIKENAEVKNQVKTYLREKKNTTFYI